MKQSKTAAEKISTIAKALLEWFSAHARDLPWRRTADPYAVWVSEIMLQQTQVKTVIPYWVRWMRQLPTLEHLAQAESETLHKLWEGLGYYSRVRNLQKAAILIQRDHRGVFPHDFAAMLELPGIGRYTAGAIASIAFNEPRPILDGNVIRVLTRQFGIGENPRDRAANDRLWELATELVTAAARTSLEVAPRAASSFNQSLMELGALVCTPKQPQCGVCPVREDCVARREDRVAELPNLPARAQVTARHFVAFALEYQGRYLVRQRPADVVNAQLWEFPNAEFVITSHPPTSAAATRAVFGVDLPAAQRLCTIKHSITRFRMTLEAYQINLTSPAPPGFAGEWHNLAELDELPFPGAHRKIYAALCQAKLKAPARRPKTPNRASRNPAGPRSRKPAKD